jgi:hypothetical protein
MLKPFVYYDNVSPPTMQNDVHLQDFIQNKRKRVWKKKDMVSILVHPQLLSCKPQEVI